LAESIAAASVVIAFYASETQAKVMLRRLEETSNDPTMELLDAAVMVRQRESRRLKIQETADLPLEKAAIGGATGGRIIRIIFPPSVLAVPPFGTPAGAALRHFIDLGFRINLLKEIGENLPPGGSAVVAVVRESWVERLCRAIEGYADFTRYALGGGAAAGLAVGRR
jgi:uncharacterized membrane protein